MSSEQPPAPGERASGLSPAMWRVLIAVGILALIGVGIAVWFFATSNPAGDPGAGAAPTSTRGPVPGGTPTTGSEVQTPDPSAAPNDQLPPRTPGTPLIEPPLPSSASGESTLVDGFPSEIMGPIDGGDVVQNSIATEGETMQVTIVVRTDASKDDISTHYGELWASLGLAPQPAGEDGSLSYSSEFESLSLAFTPASGTGTVYMLYGVFRTS